MVERFDAVVVGLGALGSAAAYHLARRGRRVLGLDANTLGHVNGSSHGRSRIFRTAARPPYVPLAQRALVGWRALEAASGVPLLRMTGMLLMGRPGTPTIEDPLACARQHGLAYELLDPAQVRARFTVFKPADDMVGFYEPAAGVLLAQSCLAVHLAMAKRHGAILRHGQPVRRWAADGAGVRVETDAGPVLADRLVIAAGPWMGDLLADLQLPLTTLRAVNIHVEPFAADWFEPTRCPVFGLDAPEGHYYGLPFLPGDGLKLGKDPSPDAVCTPDTVRRTVEPAEIDDFRQMIERYIPAATGPVKWTLTCLYTMTPDRDFIVDRHPAHPQVALAGGGSGHAFKFSGVIGEALADLALDGATTLPIDFCRLERPAPERRAGRSDQ